MINFKSPHVAQITNMLLRLATLVAKLGLTLYMGRYVDLADIGTYGLVFGAVMVLTSAIGMRLDYIVSREIVGQTPGVVLAKMRDQLVFYLTNFAVLGIIMFILTCVHADNGTGGKIMSLIYILAVVEGVANLTYVNITSIGHPLFANLLFFVRSGLWAIIIAVVGLLFPAFRNADSILVAWIVGASLSLVATFWVWRDLPWGEVMRTQVDWVWIRKSVIACFFVWLGACGTTAGYYVDRFVVAHYLSLDMAGVVTFYFSFTTALITLAQSGVLAFAYPRLIKFHREKNTDEFWHEIRRSGWHVALFATASAIAVGVCVPLLGHFFHRSELVDEAPTLWLMLGAAWLRCNAWTLYYILFARHQDRAIWLGDLLYLVPAFGFNLLLVPLMGFIGIGYGAVLSNLLIVLWRLWYVRVGNKQEAVA